MVSSKLVVIGGRVCLYGVPLELGMCADNFGMPRHMTLLGSHDKDLVATTLPSRELAAWEVKA